MNILKLKALTFDLRKDKKNDGKTIEYEYDVTGYEDRHHELCMICKFDQYPYCREICNVGK